MKDTCKPVEASCSNVSIVLKSLKPWANLACFGTNEYVEHDWSKVEYLELSQLTLIFNTF